MRAVADFFAVLHDDPEVRRRTALRLQADGWELHLVHGWVAGVRWLPGGVRPPPELAGNGCFVVQGVEALQAARTDWRHLPGVARQGADGLRSLPGDFAIVSLVEGVALVARAVNGLVPFHVQTARDGIVISTRVGPLRRWSPLPQQTDVFALAALCAFGGLYPDSRSVVEGAKVVERGHVARASRAGITQHSYWTPPRAGSSRPSAAAVRDHAHELREHLREELRGDLDHDQPNLVALSGGVDSSCLASLVQSLDVPASVAISAYLFPGARPRQYERDLLAEADPLLPHDRHHLYDLTRHDPVEAVLRGPRLGTPLEHRLLLDLPRFHSGERVFVGGELADDVVGSHESIADWVAAVPLIDILRRTSGVAVQRRRLLREHVRVRAARRRGRLVLTHMLDRELDPLLHPDVRAEWRELIARMQRRHPAHHPRAHLALCLAVDAPVSHNWEACAPFGLRRSWPFMSRRVLDAAFAWHPTEVIGARDKLLLRQAFVDLVPPRVLARGKSAPGLDPWVDAPYGPWRRTLRPEQEAALDPRFLSSDRQVTTSQATLLALMEQALDEPMTGPDKWE